MQLPIYLDYMATTPVDPRVTAQLVKCLGPDGVFGNASSQTHSYGYAADELIERARQQIADCINADPREIIFTSGATESNNFALKGIAQAYQRQGKHIVTMATEHSAVLDTCRHLESIGFEVTYLKPQHTGLLDSNEFQNALRDDTILVSIMHVNNETGVVQDIAKLATLTRARGILFHSDAAQSVGKIQFDVKSMAVDLASLSAHKVYGPKGIGALYIRRTPPLHLQIQQHGGGHERRLRSGTLPTHQIVAMGEAFELAKNEFKQAQQKLYQQRQTLLNALAQLHGVHINGDVTHSILGCLNLRFDGVEGESLLMSLRDLALSTGSACDSASMKPSHVLMAMGLTRQQAYDSIRLSFGRFTTDEEIDYATTQISKEVQRLRKLSPIWDEVKQRLI